MNPVEPDYENDTYRPTKRRVADEWIYDDQFDDSPIGESPLNRESYMAKLREKHKAMGPPPPPKRPNVDWIWVAIAALLIMVLIWWFVFRADSATTVTRMVV